MKKYILSAWFVLSVLNLFAIDGMLLIHKNFNLEDNWYRTVYENAPYIATTGKVYQDEFFFINVVFGNYKADEGGHMDVIYDIKITDPENKIYFQEKEIPAVKTEGLKPGGVYIARGNIKINLETDKPLGKYKVEVVLKDKIDKSLKKLEGDFVLAAFKGEEPVKSDDELGEWMMNYYKTPEPGKVLANYLYYAQSAISENDSSFVPMFAFVLNVFNNNKFLVPIALEEYKKLDLKAILYLLWLFRYSDYDFKDFFAGLKGDEKTAYEKIKDGEYVKNPYKSIEDGGQLDALWGEFFATGNYKPIKRLVEVLEYGKYEDRVKNYKNITNPTRKDKDELMKGAIFGAAVKSLLSNCSRHDLVFDYCYFAYKNEKDLDAGARSWLASLLKNVLKQRDKEK
ncbi:MAG: hypothetical protein JXR81_10505 [Candidatus Goldbacteria bacterium]|nr:hypothetical protein [Candidatus Goldiibacteriota bacterium]